MIPSSIPAALADHAARFPDGPAYTFLDYDVDPAGYAETLTWAQVQHRAQVIGREIASYGSPGDRVAICAPQGLEYVLGFYGVLAAGFIAVPLPVPALGKQDERVTSALKDCAPVAILTTSTAVDDVTSCVGVLPGPPPAIVEVDAMDLDAPVDPLPLPSTKTALLQYTSGSTSMPKGVTVTHRNIFANLEQVVADYFDDTGGMPLPDTTLVSWLPFFHDMGMLLGITGALGLKLRAVLMSPIAFLQKPARWVQQLAENSRTFTASPNFAFELAARRTSDADMAGYDLSDVHTILSGSERIHAATIRRFNERFAQFNLPENAVAPSYGLAEAMVYAGSAARSSRPHYARFDYEKLAAGHAEPCEGQNATELVDLGVPRACILRIVDPDKHTEKPIGEVGEVWLHGDNIATGYWKKPQQTEQAFGGRIVDPAPGTPSGRWLRTGDLGVITDDGFYIVGRIKDMLIIDGRNHYPDDIEGTVQELSRGRAVAISVTSGESEQLAVIVEVKQHPGGTDQELQGRMQTIRQEVTSAVSKVHGVRIGDLVLVPQGAIPITTSGKVRRSSCVEIYQKGEFTRLDAVAPTREAVDALR
ncbi:MAG TPA: AMP-binding protein [Mycobacterium sp.]|nr:AMP-binding protein [Mycobacterium sp.]